ncbi:MAG TPA: subclass B3 metallo-beta-lactamase [Longimicrobiales bacterium]
MKLFGRRRWLVTLLGVAVAVVVILGLLWRSAIKRTRGLPDEPFRIAGNLYYVGNAGVTSFLLTGPDGHVLIDGGYPESAAAIMASIAKLGFDIADVRILLNTHAHSDHAGGLRALQEASGAELWVSEGDADVIAAGRNAADSALGPLRFVGLLGFGRFPPPRIDHRFEDGDTIRLGPIELTAHVTAGHTRGCTSWSFPVRDGDRELLAVDICSLTLFPFVSLVDPESYPGIRTDYERSFRTLRSLPADIFLASHGDMFGMNRKRHALADTSDSANPFIDPEGYRRYIDRAEEHFRKVLADQTGGR